MRLSRSEETLLKWLQTRMMRSVTPEEAASVLYKGRVRPKTWRGVTLAMLLRLSDKLPYIGKLRLTRHTGLGRGKKAVYVVRRVP